MVSQIRILLVDDHAVLRAGLRILLNAEEDMLVVGEASSTQQAIEQAAELKPGVILMDISMPIGNGLDIIRELSQAAPESRILMLTMHNDEGYLRRALSSGAAGYVLKQAANNELLAAIRVVNQGGTYLHPDHKAILFESQAEPPVRTDDENEDYNRLSPREKEILRLIVMGYTNRQAAEELFLSEKTIETYKSRLLTKLGLHSRIDLVRFALRIGLVKA